MHLSAGPFVYTGSAFTPCSVTVTGAGGLNLTPAPSYDDNTNAGTATASYTFAGDANHTGSSDSETFTIDKASSTTTVTCPAGPFQYSGVDQHPASVTVTGAGGLSLTPAPSYDDNIDAGTATASYTYAGDANHTGSSDSETFTIDKAEVAVDAVDASKTYADADPSFTYVLTGLVGGQTEGNLRDADSLSGHPTCVRTGSVENAGFYEDVIGCEPGDLSAANYTFVSGTTADFTIDKASSTTTVTCTAGPFVYTGSAFTPCSVTVTGAGGLSLTPAPSYDDNTDAGTATASYTYAGDANHTGSNGSKTFTIDKAISTTTVTCPASIDLHRLGPDAVHGGGDRRRRAEPVAHRQLH